ncbi:MAG: hypothetical protein M1609_03835 [Firmicutes bacterium]|nr:hypothetical protein [Bacillota bacterium]
MLITHKSFWIVKNVIIRHSNDNTPEDVKFWAIIKPGYNGNHKQHYVPTVVELLKHSGLKETDVVIAVDKVEKSETHMEKYIRKIKKEVGMPGLEIYSAASIGNPLDW